MTTKVGDWCTRVCIVPRRRRARSLLLLVGVLDEPVEGDVNLDVIFCGNGVQADFTALNGLQVTK